MGGPQRQSDVVLVSMPFGPLLQGCWRLRRPDAPDSRSRFVFFLYLPFVETVIVLQRSRNIIVTLG